MFINEETIYKVELNKSELNDLRVLLSNVTRNILTEDQECLLNDLIDTIDNS